MKNVAILVQNLHNGGAERMAANLSIELARYYNVYLFVFDSSNAIYPYGGKLVDLKVPPLEEASAYVRASNVMKRIRRLSYLKKKYKIDCTISHMDGANVVNILSRRGDKVICVYHSMPSMCESGSFVNKSLHRFIGNGADKYVCVSRMAAADMAASFGVKKKKLQCIYNFADLEKTKSLRMEELPSEAAGFYSRHKKILITVGRLTHMKAQDRLIRVLQDLRANGKNVGLVILGEGDERQALEELASDLGLRGNIYMPGEVGNPFPYMAAASVFALVSDFEGLPMVLIEAAACGLPIVSVDIPSGPREVLAPDTDIYKKTEGDIEYAKYGLLVPSCANEERRGGLSPKEKLLEEGISRLMFDEVFRQKYLSLAEECVERFSAEKIIGQWRELIEEDKK